MSLNVESGAGLPDSESYASVAQSDDYHGKRGNSAWAALTNDQKEIALRKATDFITQSYRQRWKGYRAKPSTQALDWPRLNVCVDDNGIVLIIEDDEVPEEVVKACCELALRSISDEGLNPDVERLVKSVSVASISVAYDESSTPSTEFKSVEMTLRPLLKYSGSVGRIVRS